jgi:hypothetical protein
MLSGNHFIKVTVTYELLYMLFLPYLVLRLMKEGKPLIERNGIIIFGVFLALYAFHALWFSSLPLVTILGFYIRLYIGYAIIRLVPDFPLLVVRVMFYICIPGLIIWLLARMGLFSPIFSMMEPQVIRFDDDVYMIGVHTFFTDRQGHVGRNAGMFWEPGAFAGYINLALLFLSLFKNCFSKEEYRKYLLVLLVALLTTMSTAGYVGAPIALLLGYKFRPKNKRHGSYKIFLSFLILTLCLVAASYVVNNVEFLGDKLNSQIEEAQGLESDEVGVETSRFATVLFDWYYFEKSPIFGNGIEQKVRYRFHDMDKAFGKHANALTDFLATYGIIGMMAFCVSMFSGFYSLTRNALISLGSLFFIMMSLFSNPFLNYPLYLGLLFLSVCPKIKLKQAN